MIEGKKVLVLDDEPLIAFMIEDALLDMGAREVLLAHTIDEAEEAVRSGVDFAILDVNVQGKQSYELADQLIALSRPFAFASGFGDMEHPPRHVGALTLTKPFTPLQLAQVLSAAAGVTQP